MRPDPTAPRRAFAVGSCAASAALAATLASGMLPTGTSAWLVAGTAGALLAGGIALLVQSRMLRATPAIQNDARLQASRMQIGLAAGFVIKLALLVLVSATLGLTGLKFEVVAAFAIAFAAASLIQQLCTAAMLSRSLGRRAHARS